MVIGYFDYFILMLIIVLNYKYWNYNIDATFGCIVYPVLFLALSIASVLVELEITRPAEDEIDDSFNHLYVLLKFPVYIALYLLLCIFLLIKRKMKVNSNSIQS